jgi:hypothetical protein
VSLVRVIALRNFEHVGQLHLAGSVVVMPAIEAAAHARRGDVSLTRGHEPLHRTDLSAEPVAPDHAAALDAPPSESSQEGTGRRRRSYRRRDLAAAADSAE